MNAGVHRLALQVSFGDCDPAGIVFYPNFFAWFDRTFHDWLRGFGGHAAICARLGARGIGLLDAAAQFRRPLQDGDQVEITVRVEEWRSKTVRLAYEVKSGGALVATGSEVRGLFLESDAGMIAGQVDPLRRLFEDDDAGR